MNDKRRFTGSIPKGPITADTELVFVAGHAFVNASKHEEVCDGHVRRAEQAEAEVASLHAQLNEAIRERDEWFAQHQELARGHYVRRAERAEAQLDEAREALERLCERNVTGTVPVSAILQVLSRLQAAEKEKTE